MLQSRLLRGRLILLACVAGLSLYALFQFFADARALSAQRVLKGHGNAVTSIEVSPNGRLIATASLDRTVRLWDAQTGKQVRVLR
ncbi:MAG TPA: hypothetical protein VEF04_04495, partial [Blastocatellia bacterium]|nr:hypothetical protein [Blastocatellia bacterium]